MAQATDVELLVVGAGPSGIAAAVEAKRLGIDVLVVDKASFPRDKTCGDGLTAAALRTLERLGLDVRALSSYAPVRETVLVAPGGRDYVLPLPGDGVYAAVVPRVELDAALVDLTRSRGVDIRERAAVRAIEEQSSALIVELADGSTVHAAWVIGADGHYSTVRRMLDRRDHRDSDRGAGPDLGTWHAFRQYFRDVDDRRLWVIFDEGLLPGYAWVFPVGGGRANVGFGVLRDRPHRRGKMMAAQWRELASHPAVRRALGPRAQPDSAYRAWPIPSAYDPRRIARGRVLYTGDAANVVDPMTGEGIAQALETGELAARAIAASPTSPGQAAARYRDMVDSTLGADLRFARLLQQILRSPVGARSAIRAAGLTPWTRRNFARWMFEDYPRAAIVTPRRWHRGMFTSAGAYRAAPAPAPHSARP
ncbi:MAG TPA: NAD(P)/FAD-dependent oxidoreductase [Acidimicrobiia bacterium]